MSAAIGIRAAAFNSGGTQHKGKWLSSHGPARRALSWYPDCRGADKADVGAGKR